MAYLVRRLLENTANESFLRQTFVEGEALERLLANPTQRAAGVPPAEGRTGILPVSERGQINRLAGGNPVEVDNVQHTVVETMGLECDAYKGKFVEDRHDACPTFANHPVVDFTRENERTAFPSAIAEIRRKHLGKTYPLHIGGREMFTSDRLPSTNPNRFTEVLGHVCQAGAKETDLAVTAAEKAFPKWRDTAPEDRAKVLFKAAEIMRRRVHELSAWQVLEVGKQWAQAHADVSEAIDFLQYYGSEMIRLGAPRRMGWLNREGGPQTSRDLPTRRRQHIPVPGEDNRLLYEPRGVAAVIAPWNFPLAISTGMVSAAIVTGNCVVYKPSGFSSIIGHQLVEIYRDAGLPDGVFNYLPGRSSVMGDHLVEHPAVSLIAFTGSLEVGQRIYRKAAVVQPGQRYLKRVICELGGKNAIIIDDDADLDEAVPQVLASAFGYQGQKCSACSRVIVLDAVYDRFVERLVAAAHSLKIGPAEDPANDMGAVIDENALKTIRRYAALAKDEGTLLFESTSFDHGTAHLQGGWFAPITIVGDIRPEHRIAQEEVFGPVLAVMRAKNFDQAIEWANSTRFALTGGVFSRSPRHLDQARREFRVGNLYLNRGCTGALVERQPFGGARMSGVGSKAGGPDYLVQFMDPRVVTENTMRRGFAAN
ncbi:L-glutamate gamma-semialdehyde dehydrogenase [bacterium]|nr:L-glutamate gamma-semialdehyde dehydrogenase [bacterium]